MCFKNVLHQRQSHIYQFGSRSSNVFVNTGGHIVFQRCRFSCPPVLFIFFIVWYQEWIKSSSKNRATVQKMSLRDSKKVFET